MSFRAATWVGLVLWAIVSPAAAHGYRFGPLEIVHPVVMVPSAHSDCSCAHMTITNHGSSTEYFLGASIAAASRTHLIEIDTRSGGVTMPVRAAIPPGGTLDLTRHSGCLFMSGITQTLEADVGTVQGQLMFETQGTVDIEFMIAPASH